MLPASRRKPSIKQDNENLVESQQNPTIAQIQKICHYADEAEEYQRRADEAPPSKLWRER